jgi:hypothetical protein
MTQVVVEPSLMTTLIQHIPWFAWIALAGIGGGTLSGIVKMIIVHRERMAMIRCGMDPDAPNRKPVYEDVDV